ncbi:MAG TPA: glycosyltransferase family 4 protein [Candidatus Kapabacteria bacterium]|nr:glycosyltransferase family 4 protein [Candidatus Kapabacteria bacterium]
MRILFVHERFGALGGAEANAVITADELKTRGHDVGLLHGAPTGKSEQKWEGVFEWRRLLPANEIASFVHEALRAYRPDVVYVHKMADLAVIEALVNAGVPLVRMVHDHDIYCMRSYKYFYQSREICTRAASPYCVYGCGAFVARNHGPGFPVKYVSYGAKKREIALNREFDRMVVVTDFMRAELLKNGFDPNKIEIHPPVPRSADPNLRSSFSDRNLIIYAGQIIRGKGVDVLLESLAMLKSPFECIILGEGSHRPYCEVLARKLGIADRVTFRGFVPQEELKNFYQECSVVALSSVWPEPIATIGLEVMRCGLPVVAFDAGGIRDWLQNEVNGFLVPWMDRKRYAAAIDRLLQDKDLARSMGQQGLRIVSDKFDFEAYVEGLEDLFQRVVAQRNRTAPSKDAALVTA